MATGIASARIRLPKTVVRSWTLPGLVAIADTQTVDSSFMNFPMHDALFDYSALNHYNGNLISPVQSAVYFSRTKKTDFLFGNAYDAYTTTPQDVRFYNTTTPYSIISYKKGFTTYHEDNDLGFLFTGNINRRTNLALTLNYLDAVGHYKNQAGKTFNGSVSGSYNGNHYSLQTAFTFNRLSNFENGGLMTAEDLQNRDMKTEDMPVNIEGMSGYRYLSFYLNHYYSLTVERDETVRYQAVDEDGNKQEKDSVRTIHIPLITFRHVFEVNDATRRYIEKDTTQTFYSNHFLNNAGTHDTVSLTTIRNTLSATFEEAYNRRLHFGATIYAANEFQRHTNPGIPNYPITNDDVKNAKLADLMPVMSVPGRLQRHWSNNTFVGGAIYKQTGKYIRYKVQGDVCLIGRKLGEFHVDGDFNAGFRLGKDSMTIQAIVSIKNETPDYFLEHFLSNHYAWQNDFKRTYRFHVGGKVAYPTQWFKPAIRVDYEVIRNLIYFEQLNNPEQSNENISVLAAELQADLTTPWINLDNHVIYQYSSSHLMPVPAIILYHNLYYHGTWFKALDSQIGIDLHYNTSYYAPYLNGAIGQFCIQDQLKVGNYPVMSVYANFYVRLLHLRFFLQYQHFNATFMNRKYYSMPYYPLNPDVFRAGLAFHFYK